MRWEIALSLTTWLFVTGVTVLGTWVALKSLPGKIREREDLFPVSILKPVKGIDADLEENLQGFFNLDYPRFELIFSVANEEDPVIPLVRGLIAANPKVPARLIIGELVIGPNPKVNNLVRSFESAQHDWVMISDSNVRVDPAYLRRFVSHVDDDVGMVSAVVAGRAPQGWGGWLEAAYLNTFYTRMLFLAVMVGVPAVVGKSMLFRRSTAALFGGIRALGQYLAEDYIAGEEIHRLGQRVVVATEPVPQQIGNHSFRAFWLRHLRWGRIRKSLAPALFLLEPLMGALVSGIIGAYAFDGWLGVPWAFFIAGHLAFWSVCDVLLMRRMDPKWNPRAALAWFLREFIALPLWIGIASGNTVNWRGTRLTVKAGSVLRNTEEEEERYNER